MRIGDFVEVANVNPVVQLSQVRDAARTEGFPSELAQLIDGYIVVEGSNAAALHGLLSALTSGGAFLLSGVYGTGKSHLMAVIGLLAEFPEARTRFAARNPTWTPLLQSLFDRRFFTVYIILDEFDPTAFALETIVAKEFAAEAERKGFSVPTDTSARGEWLHSVWQTVRQKGFSGIVILLDELAMFLNAKSGENLSRDASFLQFLAQATARLPLLLIGALQRGVEDLQRVEPYALTQVRDRFQQTWLLGLAHALPLINQVLVRKRNEAQLLRLIAELRQQSEWAQKFSVEQLLACYPFHPLTVRCLEKSIGAFFSRTRSIVTFVQWSVTEKLNSDWWQLITPDMLVEHFEPDMHIHPQLRPFAQQVLPYFRRWDEGRGTGDEAERLVKTLLAFQVGGEEPSAQTLADALMKDANEIWALLERLRTEANFLESVKRTGSPNDTYRLDPQITVTDALRRRLNEAVQSLADDDSRLLRFAWECRSEDWTPPPLFEMRTLTVSWMRTQSRIAVTVTDLRRLTETQLRQIVASLSSPHTDECMHLLVAVPVAIDEQRKHFEVLMKTLQASLPANEEATGQKRFASAVAALLPRKPNNAEMRRWKENAAVWLLVQDLSLAESELGMKMLERLREMLPARQWETQRLMQRLYGDGVLMGLGVKDWGLEVGKLVGSEFVGFDELVRVAAEQILPQVFPKFPDIAPRREASAQTYHALARLILKGLPTTSLDINAQRWLELVAMPLGVVAPRSTKIPAEQTQPMQVTTPPTDLTDAVLKVIGNGSDYRRVEAELAKSEFGLTPELTQLLTAAMLRLGWLIAFDRNGEILMPENISTPFARSIALLRPAQVLSGDEWRTVRTLLEALLGDVPATITPERQQQIWMQLREAANSWKLVAQDVSARLAQWQREMSQSERQWQRTIENIHFCAELTDLLTQPLNAADGFRQLVGWARERGTSAEGLRRWRNEFETAAEFFAQLSALLNAMHYLQALGWLPEDLAKQRNQLLSSSQSGERLLSEWRKWLENFRHFQEDYAKAYIAHHDSVYSSKEFDWLRSLRQSEKVRLLDALSSLPEAPADGQEAIGQLEEALARQCSETSLTLHTHLRRSPFCPRCGLTIDKAPSVEVENLTRLVDDALAKLKVWFCTDERKARLQRFIAAVAPPDRALLEQVLSLTPESDDEQWRSVLVALPILQKALSPHAVVDADLNELCGLLEGRYLTCDEATEIFRDWLKGKVPSSETKIRFVRQDSKQAQRARKGGESDAKSRRLDR
ncbi:MAG: hypothetical protein LASZOEIN_000185 [Candidatus Fervidibacter sp.]